MPPLPPPTRRIWLALALLVAAGGFLRLYALGHQSYWMDEGYTINAVTAIVEKGSSILDSGLPYSCPAYCIPTARLVSMIGASATAYRLLAALAGIAFIPLIFFITRRLFDRNIAFLSTFFVTFSYWQIAWSRQARWYTLYELFVWITLYFFYQHLDTPRSKKTTGYLLLAIGFSTLAIVTHMIGLLLPFILLAWMLRGPLNINKLRVVVAGAVGAIALAVGAEYISGHHLIGPILANVRLHYELPYWLHFYLRTYWLMIPFCLFALFHSSSPHAKPLRYLLFPFACYLAAFSFFTDIIHYRYLFALTPALLIGGAIGIIDIAHAIRNRWIHGAFLGAVIVAFFASGMGVWHPMDTYWLESDNPQTLGTRPHYATTPQPDWNAAYAYIAEHRRPGDLVISSNPVFTKIFLHEPGAWIKYNYLGIVEESNTITNDHEYYVNAKVIDDLVELKALTASGHGWIIIDAMALDGRIPKDIQQYIASQFTPALHLTANPWSSLWVWKF